MLRRGLGILLAITLFLSNSKVFAKQLEKAKDIKFDVVDIKTFSLGDFKGKVVFLNFWATWCPPCRAEIPILNDFYLKNKQKVEIIGVLVENFSLDQLVVAKKAFNISYIVTLVTGDILKKYGPITSIPTTYIITPSGKVLTKHIGMLTPELLNKYFNEALKY